MVSAGGGGTPRWRRDGREIFYLSAQGDLMSVPLDTAGRPGTPVALFHADRWTDFDVMPDGMRFVAIVQESIASEEPLTILLNWRRMLDPR